MVYEDSQSEGYFGGPSKTISEATQQTVDAEIRLILDTQYAEARKMLEANRDKVEAMAKALLDWETIDADQIGDIMQGNDPRPPKVSSSVNKPSSGDGGVAPGVTATA
jgi:cell division protease FtsH